LWFLPFVSGTIKSGLLFLDILLQRSAEAKATQGKEATAIWRGIWLPKIRNHLENDSQDT
jgi:hypothetical protein